MENELIAKGITTDLNSFKLIDSNIGEPIIIIDEKGFKYKGELIEDSGEIYKLFKEFFQSSQLPQQQTYTLEQMRMAFDYGKSLEPFDSFEEFINSLTT